jgi:amino-acid N-acetyltransferase
MLIRAATSDDVPTIVSLIGANARKGGLLPRSEASIRAGLHNFLVAQLEAEDVKNGERDEGMNGQPPNSEPQTPNLKVVGCGSLMPMNTTLVELRSLAVDETLRGFGIGQKMVAALVAEARARKFGTIFALTRAVSFFERCGFVITPKENFPEKVWRDCVACPLLAHCDEVAVTMILTEEIVTAGNLSASSTERKTAIQPPFQNQFKQPARKRMSNKPEVNKVVLAYSGGLDTSVIVPWLIENYHCEVVAGGRGPFAGRRRSRAARANASCLICAMSLQTSICFRWCRAARSTKANICLAQPSRAR